MAVAGLSRRLADADPLQARAAQLFADDLAVGRVPSVRAIRTRLHAGQPCAQRAQAYLTSLTTGSAAGTPLERLRQVGDRGTTGSSIGSR
jgi:hypothetical protein